MRLNCCLVCYLLVFLSVFQNTLGTSGKPAENTIDGSGERETDVSGSRSTDGSSDLRKVKIEMEGSGHSNEMLPELVITDSTAEEVPKTDIAETMPPTVQS